MSPKYCPKCGETKDISLFGMDKSRKGGRYCYCKSCQEEGRKRHREKTLLEVASNGYVVKSDVKWCPSCKAERHIFEFGVARRNTDGLGDSCLSCVLERNKKYQSTESAKLVSRERKSRPEVKKRIAESVKKTIEKNKEKYRESSMLRSRRNAAIKRATHDSRMISDSEYASNYRMRARIASHRRRSKMNGTYSIDEWMEILSKRGSKCLRCGATGNICVDHVIPIYWGGSNTRSNLQPLCLKCNASKGAKFIDYRPWTMDHDDIGLGS